MMFGNAPNVGTLKVATICGLKVICVENVRTGNPREIPKTYSK